MTANIATQLITPSDVIAGDKILLMGRFYLVDRVDSLDSPLAQKVAVVDGEPWMALPSTGAITIQAR